MLAPRIKFSGAGRMERCYEAIDGVIEALREKDIIHAREQYIKARKFYIGLDVREKKKIYGKLVRLYRKLKNK